MLRIGEEFMIVPVLCSQCFILVRSSLVSFVVTECNVQD
jgi:hypothetical protein